jgi:hypothetical protein
MAWTLSTGAAVTLSWWGVHTVMSGTAYDRPRALPLPADPPTRQAKPQISETHREPPARKPEKKPEKKPTQAWPTPRPATTPPAAGVPEKTPDTPALPSPQTPDPTPTHSEPERKVESRTTDGGLVVFDMGETSAELASATPNAGWQMQVWKQPQWIRVTFTKDGREISVICAWNAGPPSITYHEGVAPAT